VNRSQFIIERDFVKLRNAIILKRREPVLDEYGERIYDDKGKPKYQVIQDLEKYPIRAEIMLPRKGHLSRCARGIFGDTR
jgi:hypothetical protein